MQGFYYSQLVEVVIVSIVGLTNVYDSSMRQVFYESYEGLVIPDYDCFCFVAGRNIQLFGNFFECRSGVRDPESYGDTDLKNQASLHVEFFHDGCLDQPRDIYQAGHGCQRLGYALFYSTTLTRILDHHAGRSRVL